MKKSLLILPFLLVLWLSFLATGASATECQSYSESVLPISSYNLLNKNVRHAKKFPAWSERLKVISHWVQDNEIALLATQEGVQDMIHDLNDSLPDFDYVGIARSDDPEIGEYSAIFYDTRRFAKIQSGNFWLSETPDVSASLGWDAKITRLVTWVELEEKSSGQNIFVFNAHFDHSGKVARRESVRLVAEKIKQIAREEPTLFLGDLNIHTPTSPMLNPLYDIQFSNTALAPVVSDEDRHHTLGGRSTPDYVWTSSDWTTCDYQVPQPVTPDQNQVSDHLPVLVHVLRRP